MNLGELKNLTVGWLLRHFNHPCETDIFVNTPRQIAFLDIRHLEIALFFYQRPTLD